MTPRKSRQYARSGATLIELLVALALLALLVGVVAQAAPSTARVTTSVAGQVDSIRLRALRSGKAQQQQLNDPNLRGTVRVLPTGRIIADTSLGLDPLTGDVRR